MKVVAFIPVRGGSKSIPLKNIKTLAGQPLLYWYCQALQNCKEVDELVVATDHQAIAACAQGFGFSKLSVYNRSAQNAQDSSSTESVMLEWLETKDNDDFYFMLCQATSPFIQSQQLSEAIQQFLRSGKDSMLSCSEQKKFFWSKEGEPLNYDPLKRPRRQDFKGTLTENGAFYMSKASAVKQSACRISGDVEVIELPEYFLTEIDEEADWIVAEALMKKYIVKHE